MLEALYNNIFGIPGTESVSLVRPISPPPAQQHLPSPAANPYCKFTFHKTNRGWCCADLQDSYQERGLPAHFCSLLNMKDVPRGEVAANALFLLQKKDCDIVEREKQRDIAAKDLEIAVLTKQAIVATFMYMKGYLHARGIIGRSRYLSSRAVFPEFLLFSLSRSWRQALTCFGASF